MTYLLGLALAILLTGCANGTADEARTYNNYHDALTGASPTSTPTNESTEDMAATPSRKPAARAPARPTPSAKPRTPAPARPSPGQKPRTPAPSRPSR